MLKLSKITTITLWVLMVISVLLLVLYRGTETLTEESMIVWSYFLLGVATVFAIGFPLLQLFTNPKGLKNILIAVVGLGALVLISYALADNTPFTGVGSDIAANTPEVQKFAGSSIILTYFLLGLAVVAVLFSEVSKSFK